MTTIRRNPTIAVLIASLLLAAAPERVASQAIPFNVLKIPNPTPALNELFGYAVAAWGTDRLLISAPFENTSASGAGAVYLFSLDGTLLATFAKTNPAANDHFGYAVAMVASNVVLIGANGDDTGGTNAGAAYLFDMHATLLTTFTNPLPGGGATFGDSVAHVGPDRVLIGAPHYNTNTTTAGAAYLFLTNGTLLTTFTSPSPAGFDAFGGSVTALGNDRVLIGDPRRGTTSPGAAYLFSTNGTLLTAFTNPYPADNDNFGYGLADMGSDRVLIGAHGQSNYSGIAYLFTTNGMLLTTFTNPTPAMNDDFGIALASVGANGVLIGADGDSVNGSPAGTAYLFNTNGGLLAAFTNPAPTGANYFGGAVTTAGNDRLLIGAFWDNSGATRNGAAYLFSLGYPQLGITRTNSDFSVTWLTPETGLILQQADALANPTVWADTPGSPAVAGNMNVFPLSVPATLTNRFYKLRRP